MSNEAVLRNFIELKQRQLDVSWKYKWVDSFYTFSQFSILKINKFNEHLNHHWPGSIQSFFPSPVPEHDEPKWLVCNDESPPKVPQIPPRYHRQSQPLGMVEVRLHSDTGGIYPAVLMEQSQSSQVSALKCTDIWSYFRPKSKISDRKSQTTFVSMNLI